MDHFTALLSIHQLHSLQIKYSTHSPTFFDLESNFNYCLVWLNVSWIQITSSVARTCVYVWDAPLSVSRDDGSDAEDRGLYSPDTAAVPSHRQHRARTILWWGDLSPGVMLINSLGNPMPVLLHLIQGCFYWEIKTLNKNKKNWIGSWRAMMQIAEVWTLL